MHINIRYTLKRTIQHNNIYTDQIIELIQVMCSQWLILLTFVCFLQLTVTDPIGESAKRWIFCEYLQSHYAKNTSSISLGLPELGQFSSRHVLLDKTRKFVAAYIFSEKEFS
jgi:hypothetical protein